MSNTQPKGLFTSLVLFITLGLFSLATLFTLLILEVRNGQQQLNQQLAALSGKPFNPSRATTSSDDLPNIEQLNQIQATLDLIANRQRSQTSTNLHPVINQLSEIENRLEQTQQSIATLPAPSAQISLPDSVTETLQQIQKTQQQQLVDQNQQIATLLTRQQNQEEYTRQITEEIKKISSRAPPTIDLSGFDLMTQQLTQIQQQQVQFEQVQQQQSRTNVTSSSNKRLEEKLDQLMAQYEQIRSAQSSMAKSIDRVDTQTPATPTLPETLLEQLTNLNRQQQSLAHAQSSLQALVEKIAQQQSSQPQPTQAPTSPRQLDTMNSQLERLTRQQQQIERNILKSMEQSNTIKPYSYNAR